MNRRQILKSGGAVVTVGTFGSGLAGQALAQSNPTMTTVVKIVGVPYF